MKIHKIKYISHFFDNPKYKAKSEQELKDKICAFIKNAEKKETLNILFDKNSKFIQVKFNFQKEKWEIA